MITANRQRIHGRLQSKLWKPPRYLWGRPLEPLHETLQCLLSRSRSFHASPKTRDNLSSLCTIYESLNGCEADTDHELEILHSIAQLSYAFCKEHGAKIGMGEYVDNKHLREVNKIGRYWGLCEEFTKVVRRNRRLFRSIDLQCLPSYGASPLPGVPSIKAHVHAEIQLLTFYALNSGPDLRAPRAIGVSRSACYLCNLFIQHHGQFFVSRTHGRLYDQWTVPDIFTDQSHQAQRIKFRQVLREVSRQIQRALSIERQGRRSLRPYPNESEATLPLSDSGTSSSGGSSITVLAGTRKPLPMILPMPPSEQPNGALSPSIHQDHPLQPPNLEEHQSTRSLIDLRLHSENEIHHPTTSLISQASSPARSLGSPHSIPTPAPAAAPSPAADAPLSTISSSTPTPSDPILSTTAYPLRHRVIPTSPLETRTKNLHIHLEIEQPASGHVHVTTMPDLENLDNAGHVVDVRALRVHEERRFERKEEEEGMVLVLRCGSEMTQVRIQWQHQQ